MSQRQETIERVREFTRFYLPAAGLLGRNYLGSGYSATDARVIFELYTVDGITASTLCQRFNIDKGQMSRIVKNHIAKGLVEKEKSTADLRSWHLHLTDYGKALAEEMIRRSNAEIGELVKDLDDPQLKELYAALDRVTSLLGGGK